MFGDLKIIMELHSYKDNPDKLQELFDNNRDKMLQLKAKYPQWRDYLNPEVLKALKEKGLPVD